VTLRLAFPRILTYHSPHSSPKEKNIMSDYRIREHPILMVEERPEFEFYWQGRTMTAREGETIAAALFANDVRVFGHHGKAGAPQGIICANG